MCGIVTGRCKTCIYWKDLDTLTTDRVVHFPKDDMTGEFIPGEYEVGICRYPKQTFCKFPEERDGFGLADGEDYIALMATAEDFGCVKWKGEEE